MPLNDPPSCNVSLNFTDLSFIADNENFESLFRGEVSETRVPFVKILLND